MSGYIGPLPVPQGIQNKETFTATAGQTTFNTNGYTDGAFINVYLNGVRLINGTDYTATNGSDIVLTQAASVSDVLDFETLNEVQLVSNTSTTPIFKNSATLKNDTEEDTDGGRESTLIFQGEQSGGEISTLAQIQASHDGTADDQKGDLIFKTNDGSDGTSPTERLRIDSEGHVGINIVPTNTLVVSETTTPTIQIKDGQASGTRVSGKLHIGEADTLGVSIENSTTSFNDNCAMVFKTSPAAGTLTERMRINSDGQFLVGETTALASNVIATFATSNSTTATSAGGGAAITIKNTNTTDNNYSTIYFANSADGIDSAIYGVHEDADGTGTSRSGELVFATANTGGGVSERMRIHADGFITSSNQPLFGANRVGLSNTTATNTIVDWNVLVNQGSHFSTSTNRFTCPVAGNYYCSFYSLTNTAGTSAASYVTIRKNGSVIYSAYNDTVSGVNYLSYSASGLINCAANDILDFFNVQGTVYSTNYTGGVIYLIG